MRAEDVCCPYRSLLPSHRRFRFCLRAFSCCFRFALAFLPGRPVTVPIKAIIPYRRIAGVHAWAEMWWPWRRIGGQAQARDAQILADSAPGATDVVPDHLCRECPLHRLGRFGSLQVRKMTDDEAIQVVHAHFATGDLIADAFTTLLRLSGCCLAI